MTKAKFFHEPFDTRIHNVRKVDLAACIQSNQGSATI